MLQILVEPPNPLALRPEDLEPLVSALQGVEPDTDVRLAYFDNEAPQVTLHEVLAIWVLSMPVTVPTINKIISLCLDALAERFKRHPNRTHDVLIYGPDGNVLKHVRQERADMPSEEVPIEKDAPPRNRPPIR